MAETAVPESVAGCREPLTHWEGRAVDELQAAWTLPRLVACRSVDSTNDIAFSLAHAGCAAGTCVLAEEQTMGRGRQARRWASPPGLGLWLSLVLRPPPGTDAGVVPLLVGLAVARSIEPFCAPATPQVKWPNDVLVGGRKVAGILCEATWEGGRLACMIAGVGLNVLHGESDFPAELRGRATSLRMAAGSAPRRADVATALVCALLPMLRVPVLDARALAELRARDALLGRAVIVDGGAAAPLSGEAAGFGEDGSLRVRTAGGTVRRVRAGSVRLSGDPAGGDSQRPAPGVPVIPLPLP